MAEYYVIRRIGGPRPGVEFLPKSIGWPLPKCFQDDGGVCLKVSESELPPQVDDSPHVARGAQYEWKDQICHARDN